SHRPMPNPRLSVTRSVKRWHNTDTVPHGPMPSKPCPQSKCVQGRHAFTTPVRGLDTSSVTTNVAMQIVEVGQLQIIPTHSAVALLIFLAMSVARDLRRRLDAERFLPFFV